MPTPHISAAEGDIAEAILLPGDPLRAKFIAETFLDDAREVTSVRGMLGFTGTYKGMPVSTMGTGMGIPSASIYVTELIRFYGVRRLVRVGSAGGLTSDVPVRGLVLASGACTDSSVNRARYGGWDYAATADFGLLSATAGAAAAAGAWAGAPCARPGRTRLLMSVSKTPKTDSWRATDICSAANNRFAVKKLTMIRCLTWIGSFGTPIGCGFRPKSTINSSGDPVTRQKLA